MPSLCSKRNVTSAYGRPLLKSIVFTAEVVLNMDARYGADVLSGNNEPCHPPSIDANINMSVRPSHLLRRRRRYLSSKFHTTFFFLFFVSASKRKQRREGRWRREISFRRGGESEESRVSEIPSAIIRPHSLGSGQFHAQLCCSAPGWGSNSTQLIAAAVQM